MKKTNKVLSVLLSIALIFTVLPFSVYADDSDFEFSVNEDDNTTVTITGYTGTDTSVEIPSTIDGYTVTRLGNMFIDNAESIISVIIPNTVTDIEYETFCSCSNLVSVYIPSSLEYMTHGSFESCYSLENVYYGGTYAQWANNWFSQSFPSDNEIFFHYNVTNIADHTITVTTVASTCTEQGYDNHSCSVCGSNKRNFTDCVPHNYSTTGVCSACNRYVESLHPYNSNSDETWTITVPNVESFSIAFSSSSKFEDGYDFLYIYDKNDTELGKYTDTDLAGQTIEITGDTVKLRLTSDGGSNFYGFSIVAIGTQDVYEDESGTFTYITNGETAAIVGYEGTATDVTVPATIGEYEVTATSAIFKDNTTIESVVLPEGLTTIASSLFYNCCNLRSVTIPSTVKVIEDNAFGLCSSLESIEIPNGVEKIGSYVFEETALKSLVFPSSVVELCEGAFGFCYELESVAFLNATVTIGYIDLNSCQNVNQIYYAGTAEQWDIYLGSMQQGMELIVHYNVTDVSKISEHTLVTTTIPPTCEDYGYDIYNCSICGGDGIRTNDTEPTGHTAGELLEHLDPTCTKMGYDIHACADCSTIIETDIDAIGHKQGEFIETVTATCGYEGGDLYTCQNCGEDVLFNVVARLTHEYQENGKCSGCGSYIESEHNYKSNTDETWTIHIDGAKKIAITFSTKTKFEKGYDTLNFLDENNNNMGVFTGDELSGRTVAFSKDTVKLRLKADYSTNYYGFAVTDIAWYYELGDVDFDKDVDADDYAIICDIASLKFKPNSNEKLAGDLNGDGAVDGFDAILLDLQLNSIE